MLKSKSHILKKKITNNLNYKPSGVLLAGPNVIMYILAIISCVFANLCDINFWDLYCSININIYLYFLHLVLTFIFIALYDFVLKKVLLIEIFKNKLPREFIFVLSSKIKIKDRFFYIFSINFLKIFLLTSIFIIVPHVLYYILFGSFLSPYNLYILIIYILYISICFNLSNCFINNKKFFSTHNMCNIAYSFTLLLSSKTTVIFLIMPTLLPFLIINCECSVVNKHITYLGKSTLKFLNKLPVVHKLVYIRVNNNFLNPSLVKFRHHNQNTSLQLNSSKVKYIPFSNPRVFTNINSKPCSVIISSLQSTKIISSHLLVFTSDKVNFIAVSRLSLVNIPNINTWFIRVEVLGSLPKSGYFKPETSLVVKWKPLKISVYSNNVLLKNTNCYKPLSDSALVEKGIPEYTIDNKPGKSLPTDFAYPWANPYKQNLDIKTNEYMDMNNISSDLLNPIVFMMNLPNDDQNPDNGEFNNGNNNKGKGKATDKEMEEWDKQNTGQEMDIDADTSTAEPEQQDFLEATRNLVSEEELALQPGLEIQFGLNTLVPYQLNTFKTNSENIAIAIARSNYTKDLTDVHKALDFYRNADARANANVADWHGPAALARIMLQYAKYFDKESGNQYNIVEGLNEIAQYLSNKEEGTGLTREQPAVDNQRRNEGSSLEIIFEDPGANMPVSSNRRRVDNITESESSNRRRVVSPVWQRLGFSSVNDYTIAIDNAFSVIYTEFCDNNPLEPTDAQRTVMRDKARNRVKSTRERELNPKQSNKKNTISIKTIPGIDPSYDSDKNKINSDITLSPEQRDIQLQAREKLHQDILKENENKKR